MLVAGTDVIHGHGLYVGTNWVFGREARRQCKPLVYHVHGFFEPWILNRSRLKKRLVHWLFENANFKHVQLWRALTAKEADQIRAQGIEGPIVVVPNGLDLREYSPGPDLQGGVPLDPRFAKNSLRLLFLSRVHPKKGLDLLLPAWARLGQRCKDWQLVIAGPDDGGYRAHVQELAKSLGIADWICFTGTVTGPAKLALLRSADLFVLPSYSEGFPMSLLEAMACELPVVATGACNFPEISQAQAGWECEATIDSLAGALRTALDADASERKQRGRKGRQLVEHRYGWAAIVEQLLEACSAHC
jgi:glycosyltransferase involved in cell wall biosynthesis